jgi:hypothetical protein
MLLSFNRMLLMATVATLILKGVIPSILSITITADPLATTLALNTTQSNTKVATVQEKSNSSSGYKITIDSTYNGKLVRAGGTEYVAYTMTYGGQNVDLTTNYEITNLASAAVSNNKDIKISYTGIPEDQLVAGSYGDTVTFTISAN